MILLPYKIDADVRRIPYFTIIICLICFIVFLSQQNEDRKFLHGLNYFCSQSIGPSVTRVMRHSDQTVSGYDCGSFFYSVRSAPDPQEKIEELARGAKPLKLFEDKEKGYRYIKGILQKEYQRYERQVPLNLTDQLSYKPEGYDPGRMLTSVVSHGSWLHIFGNLVFFFVFAACLENILGYIKFSVIILTMAVTTSLAYSYSLLGLEDVVPTIGLSGVVSGVMAMQVTIMPISRVKCFFLLIVFFKFFRIPALILVGAFLALDLYHLTSGVDDGINYMAHVSGAVTGIVLGVIYRFWKPQRVLELSNDYYV